MITARFLPAALFATSILFTVPAQAGDLATTRDAVALADSAMQKIAADDIDGALDLLKPRASADFGEVNGWTKGIADTYRARPGGFGDPLGYTFVGEEERADTILRVTYIQKFSRKPLQWDFFFYKPKEEWLVWEFQFRMAPALMFNMASNQVPQPPR